MNSKGREREPPNKPLKKKGEKKGEEEERRRRRKKEVRRMKVTRRVERELRKHKVFAQPFCFSVFLLGSSSSSSFRRRLRAPRKRRQFRPHKKKKAFSSSSFFLLPFGNETLLFADKKKPMLFFKAARARKPNTDSMKRAQKQLCKHPYFIRFGGIDRSENASSSFHLFALLAFPASYSQSERSFSSFLFTCKQN